LVIRGYVTKRVALTGGIATGKSHVRAQFEALGVPTFDADAVAKDSIRRGGQALEAVTARFGADLLDASGDIERRKLATIIFSDPQARRDLEAMIHPIVRRATDAWYRSLDPSRHPFAVAEIPLLFETGREAEFDTVIVTACEPETQVRRVITRDHVTEAEARQRIATQLPIEEKVRRADYVIRTDATLANTDRQVRAVHEALLSG
jgi:dephospho-CoA kinase